MMPDLGKYAAEVLGAYGVGFVLLALLVWQSWRRAARVSRDLAALETRIRGGGGPAGADPGPAAPGGQAGTARPAAPANAPAEARPRAAGDPRHG